ncbi:MAG: NAD(P)/FAD-dependent oxidoreductase [Mycobacteriales bacterium]
MSSIEDAGLLVVGAGQAALQLACSLREGGYDGRVTLVGDERHPPYQRPPLSKAFLKGAGDAESLAFRTAEFYQERAIRVVTGDRVEQLDLRADGSGTAICASDRSLGFARLVFATGARARQLPLDGAGSQGVHCLRDIEQAHRLRADLERATDVVVLGGGFIGLEVAATARLMGKNVTVLEAGPSLLGRAVGPVTSRHVQSVHERAGIHVRLGARATRLASQADRVCDVELADGTSHPAQLVVIGVGARPRVALAERAGLLCRDGIVVDEHGVASDGVTLAIGDCASTPDPTPGADPATRCRLESVDSAVEQATAAANTLLGAPSPYRGVPWFWSDQGGVKLQIAGLSHAADECVVRRYPDGAKLTAVYYRAGRMVAVDAVNAPADAMSVRRALEQGASLDPREVADVSLPFKALLGALSG